MQGLAEASQVLHIFHMYLRAQSVDVGPPLGTVLGHLGVSIQRFSKDFNKYTSKLPLYFIVRTKIVIFTNKEYAFSTRIPPSPHVIKALRLKIKML